MKVSVISDLHLDFRFDDFNDICSSLINNKKDSELLIVGGDTCEIKRNENKFREFMTIMSSNFNQVVLVAGNHEYYNCDSIQETHEVLESVNSSNVRFLNNNSIIYNNHVIYGGTGWYPRTPLAVFLRNDWSDFRAIKKLEPFVWKQNESFNAGLENLNPNDNTIIVSHMLVSDVCIAQKYMYYQSNCFFLNDCEDLIAKIKPKLVTFGHTHMPMDLHLNDKTRLYSNPAGYPYESENSNFLDRMVVEI